MTEIGNVKEKPPRHPIVALVLDNPISALNAAMILIGGGMVWQSNESRMSAMEKQIARVEDGYKSSDAEMKSMLAEARARLERSEGLNAGKLEAMSTQINASSVKLSAIEASMRFLVDSQRRRPND